MLQKLIEDSLTTPIEDLPVGLKSLRKFRDTSDYIPAEVTPTMLLALMRLPCIRKITTGMQPAYHYTHDSNDLAKLTSSAEYRGKSTVQKLSFQYGGFCASLLGNILQVPRALTHFSYEDAIGLDTLQTAAFRSALRHLRPTLQYLKLGWVNALEGLPSDEDRHEDDEESYTIGSLRDWPVLRSVECGLLALVGRAPVATCRLVDVVPRVIIQLKVHQTYGVTNDSDGIMEKKYWTVSDVTDQVVELLERREECGLQELAEVTVCTWEEDAVMDTKARLEAACTTTSVIGVRVNVVDTVNNPGHVTS